MEQKLSENIFKEYQEKTQKAVNLYINLKNCYPFNSFPVIAKIIWKTGMLSEIWGTIASKLNKHGRNYLTDWREGKPNEK